MEKQDILLLDILTPSGPATLGSSNDLAEGIVKRRLTPAAIFFLESVKPLGYVGSQVLLFFRPIIQTLWSNPHTYDTFASILERRGSIELLLRRIEAKA